MPCGFPAYDQRIESFQGYSRKELHLAADYALEALGWRPRKGGKWRLVATVPNAMYGIMMTLGAKFIVKIDHEEVFMRSEGTIAIAWLDIGQHGANVKTFLVRFEDFLDQVE